MMLWSAFGDDAEIRGDANPLSVRVRARGSEDTEHLTLDGAIYVNQLQSTLFCPSEHSIVASVQPAEVEIPPTTSSPHHLSHRISKTSV